jgi:hypothetical protein
MKAFFEKAWEGIKWFSRKFLSPILDRQWDPDPYKIGGFALLAVAIKIAFDATRVISSAPTDKILALAGLASAFITAGTFMFGHSKNSDNTLESK